MSKNIAVGVSIICEKSSALVTQDACFVLLNTRLCLFVGSVTEGLHRL